MEILKVNQLQITYDQKTVIKDCSFDVQEGEIVAILGASGEGKTSILKAIAGKLVLGGGSIHFKGDQLKDPSQKLMPGIDEIKLVDQDFDLDIYHTVEENIRIKLLQFDKEYQTERVELLLHLIGLENFRQQKAKLLSGGQKQRLAIARALANEPELVLLDEPFNQLDFKSKSRISSHIQEYLKENGIAALMVTHNGLEAMEWADKVIYLEEGEIKREDEAIRFYENPKSLREAEFFGKVNQLEINGQLIYFRPGDFRLEKDENHPFSVSGELLNSKKMGWYTEYIYQFEKQVFRLFSAEDLTQKDHFFVHLLKLND